MKVLGSIEWRAWWREWWCGGQNKNGTIVGLWMHLISEGSLMKLSTGFRLLDTPCCLATTTLQTLRAVCKIQHIYTPAEYMDGVRKARRHNQFEVHQMTSDCSSLSKCFTMGKTKCWWRENNVQKCDSYEISRKPIKHDAKWNIPTMKRKHGKMYTWTREDEIGTWKWQALQEIRLKMSSH